jgi:hypothetical protein
MWAGLKKRDSGRVNSLCPILRPIQYEVASPRIAQGMRIRLSVTMSIDGLVMQ